MTKTTAAASRTMSFDDWMDHKGSSGGGDYLKKWKEDGEIDVVLHPAAFPAVVWSHSWYSVFVDRETKKEKLRFTRFNSMESEKVLTKQRFRRPDGSREFPPELCPFSLLLEWVRAQIEEGKISWVEPIFDIAAGEDGEIIHAGGFCNLFGRDDLSDDELAELRKAGIRRDEAYTENGAARMQYVLPVIPYDEPALGCVVAIETQALGDKLKKCIRDRREDLGEDGDPRNKPVVFRWVFDDKKTFSNKYDVKVMSSLPVSLDQLKDDAASTLVEKITQLQAALESTPPPINKLTDPSNLVQLRKSFEQYWVCKATPPWDELFARAMAAAKGTPAAQDPADFDTKEIEAAGGDDEADPSTPAAGAPAQDGDEVECDKCHKGMPETADTCPHCGAKYVFDKAEGYMVLAPEPEPAPKPRSRSAAAAARAPKRQAERDTKS